MVSRIPTWSSTETGDSRFHMDIMWTWLLQSFLFLMYLVTLSPPGPHLDLVTLVLPGHHRHMVTLFLTGTDLILVTLLLTLASSVPGDSGSTWTSPVTCDSDPKHGLT